MHFNIYLWVGLLKKTCYFHFKAFFFLHLRFRIFASSCTALKILKELKVIVCFQGTSQLCSFLWPCRKIWDQNSGLSSHTHSSQPVCERICLTGGLLSADRANVPVWNNLGESISKAASYLRSCGYMDTCFLLPRSLPVLFVSLCFVTAVMFSSLCRSCDS